MLGFLSLAFYRNLCFTGESGQFFGFLRVKEFGCRVVNIGHAVGREFAGFDRAAHIG